MARQSPFSFAPVVPVRLQPDRLPSLNRQDRQKALQSLRTSTSTSTNTSNGLRAEYFDNENLSRRRLVRTDETINFNWGNGSPDPAIAPNTFSVRWTGQIQPRYSETYTFLTRVNDGVRLWVNGRRLINQWQARANTATFQGQIPLEANRQYRIRMEYLENQRNAVAKLFWSSPSQTREIVPQSALFTSSSTSDSTAPTASLIAENISQRGDSYDFQVTYADDIAIQTSTLDDQDIRVTGVNGFDQIARRVSVDQATDGTPRTVTYRITAPGGRWDGMDNGSYRIALRPNQVSDTSGNSAQARDLGQFQVNIRDLDPLPPIQLSPYLSGLNNPTDIVHAKDGSNRLFMVEKSGQIRIVQNGALLPTPFLNISDRVATEGEQGLLSLAFPPNYASKQHFYVYYTNQSGNLVLSRFQVSAANVADPNSETILLTIPHPTFTNHNGGKLAFGPDGYLYLSTGDGGGGGDPNNNAQNPSVLLGKILRLDVESGTAAYQIPSTNPFQAANDPTDRYRDEIWALGLRNPWRISFDRQTGDLYIADVGQNQREEVNFQPARSTGGENYGWKILEGTLPFSDGDPTGLVAPIAEYSHSQGLSITGGSVYRGSEFPALQGTYFYGDFVNGKIWGLRRTDTGMVENNLLLDTDKGISPFGEDEAGNLYVADYFTGSIYRLGVSST